MKIFRRLVAMFLATSIVAGCLPGLVNFREFAFNQNVLAYEGENQSSEEDIELLTLEDLYGSSKEANPYDNYEEFVIRLYNVTLEREADESGLNYWSSQLRNHEITGITVAYNFVMSNEFQNKPYSEDEYISLMYNAFFGRDAADSEIAYWADLMRSGVSRDVIFENFGNSDEFYTTCSDYGIIAGTYRSDADNWQTSKVNLFVDGLYSVILGRHSDKGGMTYWTNALINGEQTGAVAAYGFVFSDEYYNKNKDDDSFVKDLYLAFLGREADEGGLNYWKNEISIGRTDLDIFNSFVLSDEFSSICNSYSIVRGGAYNGDRLSARSGRIITCTPTPLPAGALAPIEKEFNHYGDTMRVSDEDFDGVYDTLTLKGGSVSYIERGYPSYNDYASTVKTIIIADCNEKISVFSSIFSDFTLLEKVYFSASVLSVGDSTFYNNPNLREVHFESYVIRTTELAFRNCNNLQAIYINCEDLLMFNVNLSGLTSKFVVNHEGKCPECLGVQTYGGTPQCSYMVLDDDNDGVPETLHFHGESVSDGTAWSVANPSPFTLIGDKFTRVVFDKEMYICEYAFYNCTSLEEVVSSTIQNIQKSAFENCVNLRSVYLGGSVNEAQMLYGRVFYGCTSLERFICTANCNTYSGENFWNCASLKHWEISGKNILYQQDFNYWSSIEVFKVSCRSVSGYSRYGIPAESYESIHNTVGDEYSSCNVCNPPVPVNVDPTQYSYEIIPLYGGIYHYIFVRTDNPDPNSFRLIDHDNVYSLNDYDTYGYKPVTERFVDIEYDNYETGYFNGGYILGSISFANYCDGGEFVLAEYARVAPFAYEKYAYAETEVIVESPQLYSSSDLLYSLVYSEDLTFWENMDAANSFLSTYAVYPLTIIDETSNPCFMLTPPFYQDQGIMIAVNGIVNVTSSSFLRVSFPFNADSLGFPGLLTSFARKMDPKCSISGTSSHAYNQITHDGESRSYGGQGNAGDYGYTSKMQSGYLNLSQVTYTTNAPYLWTFEEASNVLNEYWNTAVENYEEQYYLCSADGICSIAGNEGSWVRISGGYYTFAAGSRRAYDNCWVDGRYCDAKGIFAPSGVTFDQHPTADILIPNVTYVNYRGTTLTGDAIYTYDSTHDCWIAFSAYGATSANANGYTRKSYDEILANAPNLILTRAQVEAMNIDRNCNVAPEHGLIYDGTAYPGTPY